MQTGKADDESEDEARQRLAEIVERNQEQGLEDVDSQVIHNVSVVSGIADTAREYDAVVSGAAKRTYSQIFFGRLSESIARNTKCPVTMVKRYHQVKALLRRLMDS